jgi:hypothetical protein
LDYLTTHTSLSPIPWVRTRLYKLKKGCTNEVFVVAEEQHEPTTNSDSVVVVAEQHEQVETVVKNQLYIHIG